MYAEATLEKNTFYNLSILDATLVSESSLQQERLLYSRSLQVFPKKFRHLDIKSDAKEDILILQVSLPDQEANELKYRLQDSTSLKQ